jgi:hypothetical protein
MRRAARRVRQRAVVVWAPFAAAAAACDPCDGVVACRQEARVSVGGQIVDRAASGAPVQGVRVEVVRTGGADLAAGTGAATTDAQGWWHVSLPAAAADQAGEGVTVDVVVAPPPPLRPYRVNGVALRTSRTRGDGQVLGRWVSRPFITYIGELRDRVSGAPIAGASVTWARRGGIEVEPTPQTRVTQTTTSIGYFTIDLRPLEYGPLFVDLVVERSGQPPATIRGVRIDPGYEWNPPLASAGSSFRLGLGLDHNVTVTFRGTGETQPGWLTWRRTGGVPTAPEFVQVPSGPGNVLPLALRPGAAGTVVGDAFFEPAGTADTVRFPGLTLATYDTAQVPAADLRYGERLAYVGRLVDAATGRALGGATVRFRRTGGIALVEDTLRVATDPAGAFRLAPATRARGEVTGELTAFVGGAARPAGAVRLATFAADTTRPLGDVRAAAAP